MKEIEEVLLFPQGKGKRDFLRLDGIWDFIGGEADAGMPATGPETAKYQGKYQSVRSAKSYNVGYQQRKQKRTQKETAILRSLLAGHAPAETVLDMPSGGGRLSPVIGEFSQAIIEMDISLGQLLYVRENCGLNVPQLCIRASGFQIPLKDGSVDGSVCIRLSHHLYSLEEKEKLLSELLRVARRFVIFSFVDSNSLKYTLRRWRHRIAGTPLKTNSISIRELKDISKRHGGDVVACPAIGPFQAHRYALIVKQDKTAEQT
jgi:ubiquinone/menaquinone biosynthesis C-methylase UbiE